jgi:Spy/CpxP family protein refolding chaperone
MKVKEVLGGLALVLGLTMPVAAAPPDIAATAHPQVGRSMDRSAMQGQRHFGGWQRHMRQGRHSRRGRSVIGFALRHRQELSLTPQQVETLKKLGMDSRRAAIRAAADRKVAQLDLMSLRQSDPVDMSRVEAKVREIERLRADSRLAAIRTDEQAKAQLTPEQREKLKGLAATRWQRQSQDSRRSDVPLAMERQ